MHNRLVMLSVAALGLAAAQRATAQVPLLKTSVGVIGGVNIAKLGGSDVTGANNRTGFAGGLFVTLHLTNSFGIEPEVLYSQQGAKADDGEGGEITVKLDYIEVPVLLRFDLPSASTPIHPFIVAGPAASYQVRCNLASSSGGSSMNASCDSAADASGGSFSRKKFDFAAVGGAGIAFNLGAAALSVSARYTYGFTDTFQDSNAKNRYWSILAGLTF